MYVTAYFPGTRTSTTGPEIAFVANAEGESPTIAPNTWMEIKGVNLAPAGDSRIWQDSDFVGNTMPTQLDKVSATVNGKNAYVYYISPTQINILTPPDTISGAVQVVVTNNGAATAAFTAQAQPISPSFFVFSGGPYVAAEHVDGSLIGPATLYPGASTPAKPGETVVIYANGFGATSVPDNQRLDHAVWHLNAAAGHPDRRRPGNCAVRGACLSGGISVQRGDSLQRSATGTSPSRRHMAEPLPSPAY